MDRNRKLGNESAGRGRSVAVLERSASQTVPPATTSVAENDPARSQKIARIRKAIVNRTYAVSASDVAGKLIDHMLIR